ncbi:signal peptidase I [Natronomonas sp. F2-12]|uniref:Signal peptidase I n=1 Tax=Natronomonas aquatica TaxID=2841590 RepID=A0A9R1CU98_9EURY|nr:signal peptidase I [Natronomonas aquatica]MCQ4333676.1 signal peptidase I [Natronomonas aquatica]
MAPTPLSVVWRLFAAVVGFFLLVTIVGGLLGVPMGISFVETGSMEPQLQPGDGFVAVPPVVAGPVEPGDVVVFDAVNLNDGGLVTHRVVEETESGYITKGDANPVTDQDGSEPPVQEGQIRAKALQIGDSIVVIPGIGVVVMGIGAAVGSLQQTLAGILGTRALLGTQGLAYILLGFGTVTYLLASVAENSGRRDRSRKRSRRIEMLSPITVIAVMGVALVLLLTASMLVPAGPQQFQFVSSQSDAAGPSVIQQGTTENVTYRVPSNGPLPVVTVIEPTSPGISVTPQERYVAGGTTENVTISIEAPPETGAYTRTIHEYRYLAVLPTGTILTLHAVHPVAPLVAINLVIGTLFVLIAVLLVGFDPIRISQDRRSIPMRVKLRRWLR